MKIVIATKNAGKLREFRRILEPLGYEVVSQKDVGVEGQAEENGTTFSENAYKKAQYVFEQTGEITLADDSGLCVDALDGRPGVYSARYGGPEANDGDRCRKLLDELKDVPDEKRTAHFACAICVLFPDSRLEVLETCEGTVGRELSGESGFGYDPIFYVKGKSFAELDGAEKDRISHRGKALRKMAEELKKRENQSHADK